MNVVENNFSQEEQQDHKSCVSSATMNVLEHKAGEVSKTETSTIMLGGRNRVIFTCITTRRREDWYLLNDITLAEHEILVTKFRELSDAMVISLENNSHFTVVCDPVANMLGLDRGTIPPHKMDAC